MPQTMHYYMALWVCIKDYVIYLHKLCDIFFGLVSMCNFCEKKNAYFLLIYNLHKSLCITYIRNSRFLGLLWIIFMDNLFYIFILKFLIDNSCLYRQIYSNQQFFRKCHFFPNRRIFLNRQINSNRQIIWKWKIF